MKKMFCQFMAFAVILAGVAFTAHSSAQMPSSKIALEIGPGSDVVVHGNNPPTA